MRQRGRTGLRSASAHEPSRTDIGRSLQSCGYSPSQSSQSSPDSAGRGAGDRAARHHRPDPGGGGPGGRPDQARADVPLPHPRRAADGDPAAPDRNVGAVSGAPWRYWAPPWARRAVWRSCRCRSRRCRAGCSAATGRSVRGSRPHPAHQAFTIPGTSPGHDDRPGGGAPRRAPGACFGPAGPGEGEGPAEGDLDRPVPGPGDRTAWVSRLDPADPRRWDQRRPGPPGRPEPRRRPSSSG